MNLVFNSYVIPPGVNLKKVVSFFEINALLIPKKFRLQSFYEESMVVFFRDNTVTIDFLDATSLENILVLRKNVGIFCENTDLQTQRLLPKPWKNKPLRRLGELTYRLDKIESTQKLLHLFCQKHAIELVPVRLA